METYLEYLEYGYPIKSSCLACPALPLSCSLKPSKYYVYRSPTESVLTFNTVSWFGNLSVRHRNKLTLVVN